MLDIVDNNALTATKIAENVFLSPSTVVGILDRLERHGLIRRDRDPNDRRLVHVSPTENGRRLAAVAPSPLPENLAASLNRLPIMKQQEIAESLERIVELMNAGH